MNFRTSPGLEIQANKLVVAMCLAAYHLSMYLRTPHRPQCPVFLSVDISGARPASRQRGGVHGVEGENTHMSVWMQMHSNNHAHSQI